MKNKPQPVFPQKFLTSRPWSEETAKQVLGLQKQSGMSLVEFADSVGLLPRRLIHWKKRLEASQTQQFLPVIVRNQPFDEVRNAQPALVVRITHHVVVDVHSPDSATASWVAQLLTECSCGAIGG